LFDIFDVEENLNSVKDQDQKKLNIENYIKDENDDKSDKIPIKFTNFEVKHILDKYDEKAAEMYKE